MCGILVRLEKREGFLYEINKVPRRDVCLHALRTDNKAIVLLLWVNEREHH